MGSVVIVSDSLGETADEHTAPERGMIRTWKSASQNAISEDTIILDTKMQLSEDKGGAKTVASPGTVDLLDYLRARLPNLLESGKTVIALCSDVERVHPTESRTYVCNNYYWLEYFGSVKRVEDPSDDVFVCNTSAVWDIESTGQDEPYKTYFLNSPSISLRITPKNSIASDYETIGSIEHVHASDEVPAVAINSWNNTNGDLIDPEGSLILLPRPDMLRINVEDWFRSLLQIGDHYSSDDLGVDQYNRVLNRSTSPTLDRIYTICNRFGNVARQLENRYNSRDTLIIDDEYDVQDLLHALLNIFFDDIRDEEWAPSYAGTSPRIDFLLKQKTISIEVKITRNNNKNKQIKEQLSVDKEHYRTHPDCKTLVCFIFDPEYHIDNPAGFERDISERTENLTTEVIVSSTSRFGDI